MSFTIASISEVLWYIIPSGPGPGFASGFRVSLLSFGYSRCIANNGTTFIGKIKKNSRDPVPIPEAKREKKSVFH